MTFAEIKNSMSKKVWVIAILLQSVFGVALYFVSQQKQPDIYSHAVYLKACIENKVIPDGTLFYLTVALSNFFSTHIKTITITMGIILALSVTARFLVSIRTIEGWPRVEARRNSNLALLLLAGMSIIYCFHVPGEEYWFCSQFGPNLWHNSTSIFVAPLAVLMFNKAMDYMESEGKEAGKSLALLTVLNVYAKPSLFFCLAPVLPVYMLCRFKKFKPAFKSLLPVSIGLLALVSYSFLVFKYSKEVTSTIDYGTGYGIALGWFEIWSYWCKNIPLSILNSMLVPLLFIGFYFREALKSHAIKFSLSLLFVGFCYYAFVQETGPRQYDGNFWWQLPICNYLLHLAVISAFLKVKEESSKWGVKDWLLAVAFISQVVAGIVYLYKVALTGYFF